MPIPLEPAKLVRRKRCVRIIRRRKAPVQEFQEREHDDKRGDAGPNKHAEGCEKESTTGADVSIVDMSQDPVRVVKKRWKIINASKTFLIEDPTSGAEITEAGFVSFPHFTLDSAALHILFEVCKPSRATF